MSLACRSLFAVFFDGCPMQFVADYRAGQLVICDDGMLDMIRQGRTEVSKPHHVVHVF